MYVIHDHLFISGIDYLLSYFAVHGMFSDELIPKCLIPINEISLFA